MNMLNVQTNLLFSFDRNLSIGKSDHEFVNSMILKIKKEELFFYDE